MKVICSSSILVPPQTKGVLVRNLAAHLLIHWKKRMGQQTRRCVPADKSFENQPTPCRYKPIGQLCQKLWTNQ